MGIVAGGIGVVGYEKAVGGHFRLPDSYVAIAEKAADGKEHSLKDAEPMKAKRDWKREALNNLSTSLEAFGPGYHGKFLCPTCLSIIDLANFSAITRAHILPHAGGGSMTTWLCSDCNSRFGTSQDKWLAEYMRFIEGRSFFSDGVTKGSITIEDISLNGVVRQTAQGLDIMIHTGRNSPAHLSALRDEFNQPKVKRAASIKVPLLSKSSDIDAGFVTAAYLYGFRIFGYSWVLQQHFGKVRKVIMERSGIREAPLHVSRIDNNTDPRPLWFGFSLIGGEYIPCFKLLNSMVFFAPYYSPDPLDLVRRPKGKIQIDVKRMNNIPGQNYTAPFCMVIDDKPIIYPDDGHVGSQIAFVVYFDSKDFRAVVLDRLVGDGHADTHRVDKKIHVKLRSSK